MNNKLIIDEKMRNIEKEKLISLGYDLIEISQSNIVYQEISSHVDIFACKIGQNVIIEPNQFENITNKAIKVENLIKGKENIGSKYPEDIKYNVCTIGKKAIHNFKYTDVYLKQELQNQGYEIINTNQGYSNCSIAVIDENSAIVTDKGLYKILQKHGIDTLFLNYEPDIKLLNKQEYSKIKGFIGGSISRIDNFVIIFGDLNKIDKNKQIQNFIQSKRLKIIDFKGLDVIDYGGIIKI